MEELPIHPLDLSWAKKRWIDPLTGTEVVRITPDSERHYRNNYFRLNMFTSDGRYAVFTESPTPFDAPANGPHRLWARDLVTGELRNLGDVAYPEEPILFCWGGLWSCWAVARHSHRVTMVSASANPEVPEILLIDISTGARHHIPLREAIPVFFDPTLSADERHVYGMWWKEKWPLHKTMTNAAWGAIMNTAPGYQEMVRIDLKTGDVAPVFNASKWWIGHPNPHPSNPNLFMCCQSYGGEKTEERERVRVIDLAAKRWLNIHRTIDLQPFHEHWAATGRRIYAHAWYGPHWINRINLETGENSVFPSQTVATGFSEHVLVAPNEKFLVGDGTAKEGVIWKYDMPKESYPWNPDAWGGDWAACDAELARRPESVAQAQPVCKWRPPWDPRTTGRRLESNARATPDSRWVVFQSSGEDDFFELWAARIPGTA